MARKRIPSQRQPNKSTTPANKDDKNLSDTFSPELLERLPDKTRTAIIEAASFNGPLPPPSLFGQYEEVLPGSAERILSSAEKEQSHRHKWDMDVLNAQKSDVRRGQWMGFGLGVLGLVVAFLSSYFGHTIVATVSIVTVLAGIVTAFLRRDSKAGNDD